MGRGACVRSGSCLRAGDGMAHAPSAALDALFSPTAPNVTRSRDVRNYKARRMSSPGFRTFYCNKGCPLARSNGTPDERTIADFGSP
jgi:hypothetical protein